MEELNFAIKRYRVNIIDIYDELMKSSIRHVLVRHEQAAVHAADAYARVTGKTGVCLATSGPVVKAPMVRTLELLLLMARSAEYVSAQRAA